MGRVKSTPRASNRRKKSRLPVTFPNNVAVTKPSKIVKPAEIDPFDVALKRYQRLYEERLRQLRKWVVARYREKRFDYGVRKELLAYFGKAKYGERPSAKCLSKHACQALELSEHDFGTDLYWGKTVAWMFGPYAPMFQKMIENAMKDYGLAGPAYVGEEDLESWVGDSDRWERSEAGEKSA